MHINAHKHSGKKKRALLSISILAGATILFSPYALQILAQATAVEEEERNPILAPCTRYDGFYDKLFPPALSKFDFWPDVYHNSVEALIEEHMQEREPEKCDAEMYTELLPPGELLKNIASLLPPWRNPEALEKLSQEDLPAVLLEYLRTYECALVEHDFLMPIEIMEEKQQEAFAQAGGVVERVTMTALQMYLEIIRRREVQLHEMLTARPTLERVLTIIGGFDRLQLLDAELQCMQRASFDIRNIVGLAADASSCLPRLWDAKDVLRDMPQCADGIDNDEDGKIDLEDDTCESRTGYTE